MSLIFVDCEAYGGAPSVGKLTEFGAVTLHNKDTFHGVIYKSTPSKNNPAIPEITSSEPINDPATVFKNFENWIIKVSGTSRPIFISDNPAFDFQWINDGFWKYIGYNPFGHSARRIGDFYAGLVNDFRAASKWKHLRVTKHDHNPVNDAMGNVEAFQRIINGER